MRHKQNQKIIKHRKKSPIGFNIGTVLFGILFIYMIICLVMYFTSEHVTAYEVTAGPLSANYRYTAFALKTEEVINALQTGTVTYYVREGGKVSNGGNVCSIDETGKLSETTGGKIGSAKGFDSESLSKLRSQMAVFASGFDGTDFQEVYNFKADMEGRILELTTERALSELEGMQSDNGISGLVNLCTAPKEGMVVYQIDGYEGTTLDTLTEDIFTSKAKEVQNLRLNTQVTSGEPLYKLLTDEHWSLIIPLDKKMANQLSEHETVKFRFLKDRNVMNAKISVIQGENGYFGKLDMSNSLIRYASERFLEIELLLNRQSGLKIPKTAIATRTFYKIPKEFARFEGENPKEIRLLKESYDKDGSAVQKDITANVYDKTEDAFLVDAELFKEGDYILMTDSSKRFQVSETESLQGVYNINKGYAVFREITVIDENEEYCLVEEGSTFGLNQYDHIALDASVIQGEQILY